MGGELTCSLTLDDRILFDAGSLPRSLDIRSQREIEYIFLTHAHLDHVIGIPFLLDNIIINNIRHHVNIVAIPQVVRAIRKNILNNSVWSGLTSLRSQISKMGW